MTHATICDHPPFVKCRINGNGMSAILTFDCEYLATRALDFNGITFLRHTLTIRRPSGYTVQCPRPSLTWDQLLAFDEGEKTKEWIEHTNMLWAHYSMADLHEWDTTYRREYEKSIQSLNEGWWYKEGRWGESTSPDDILCDVLVDMAENMPFLAESLPLCGPPVKSSEEVALELFDEMLNDIGSDCASPLDQNHDTAGLSVAEMPAIPPTDNHPFHYNGPPDDQHPEYPPLNNDELFVTMIGETVEGRGSNHSSGEFGSGRNIPLIGDSLGLVTAVSMEDSELDGMPPTSTTSTAYSPYAKLLPPTSPWQYNTHQPIPYPSTENDNLYFTTQNEEILSCSETPNDTNHVIVTDDEAAPTTNTTKDICLDRVKESGRLPWPRTHHTLRRRVTRKSRGRIYVRVLQQLGVRLGVMNDKSVRANCKRETLQWGMNGTDTFTPKVNIARIAGALAEQKLEEIICHFRKRGL